jgi:hypothetical protein
MMAASAAGALDRTSGFFGGGSLLLMAGLCLAAESTPPRTAHGLRRQGWRGLARLGLRNAADRPGRSVLVVAVIASATFMVISVDAFPARRTRRDRSPLRRRRLCAPRQPRAADRQRSQSAETAVNRWDSPLTSR